MKLSRRAVVLVWVASAAALVSAMCIDVASAAHVRPKGATPLRVPIVPAFDECTAPNSVHGPPLDSGSCTPPVHSSSYLTIGTPESNAAESDFVASVTLKVDSVPPEDLLFTVSATDVRCRPTGPPDHCNVPNTNGPPDYSGEVQAVVPMWITDHFNGLFGSSLDEAATTTFISPVIGGFPVTAGCLASVSPTTGATCHVATSADAIAPGAVPDAKRMVVEVGTTQLFDGGADGDADTYDDNTLFGVQGIYVP